MSKKYKKNELLLGEMGASRHKAIGTLAKRKNISYEEAKRYQAEKIVKEK